MGYSACEIARKGDELVIVNPSSTLAALQAHEQADGHISWCPPLSSYTGSDARVVVEVLNDFGFRNSEITNDGHVTIGLWDGDKLGSSWEAVLAAIADGTDPVALTTLYMVGEDGALWAEQFHGGVCSSPRVVLTTDQ